MQQVAFSTTSARTEESGKPALSVLWFELLKKENTKLGDKR